MLFLHFEILAFIFELDKYKYNSLTRDPNQFETFPHMSHSHVLGKWRADFQSGSRVLKKVF